MDDKDLLDELKERIKEGPVIFTPDNDFLDRLNPKDDIEWDMNALYDSFRDAADDYKKVMKQLEDEDSECESKGT